MKILITAGPTIEDIDDVRYISNRSSGKMGYAIARAAANNGHEVILVSGPVNLKPPKGIELINVRSAREMSDAVTKNIKKVQGCILTAAVSDYRPEERFKGKIKKKGHVLDLRLVKNPDIAYLVGKNKKNKFSVGFALETENGYENAIAKLKKKNFDIVILNDTSNIGSNNGTLQFINKNGIFDEKTGSKNTLAKHIIKLIEQSF